MVEEGIVVTVTLSVCMGILVFLLDDKAPREIDLVATAALVLLGAVSMLCTPRDTPQERPPSPDNRELLAALRAVQRPSIASAVKLALEPVREE